MRIWFCAWLLGSLSLMGWGAGFLPDRRFPAPAIRPYSGSARIKVNNSIGCGYLVGPDLLLTAAHVVCDPQGQMYPDIVVECGVEQGKPAHEARVKQVTTSPNVDRDPASGNDWALVRLDRPLGELYGWLECLEASPEELASMPVEVIAYAGFEDDARQEFRDFQKAFVGPGTIRDVGEHIVFHDCPIWGGSSGSALITWKNLKPYVVAVVSAGVDVEGEVLERGFRRNYQKELANIAVPSHRFLDAYRSLQKNVQPSAFRSVWVRNVQRQPIKVRLRYRVAGENTFKTTDSIEIASQKRVCILKPSDGCSAAEVFLNATTLDNRPLGPKPTYEFTVGEEKLLFFRRHLGSTRDFTLSLP